MAFTINNSSSEKHSNTRSTPSMCIPFVFPNITKERVWNVFKELHLGHIDRIDMINKQNDKGEKFKRVFIHMKYWNSDEDATQVRNNLLNGEKVKVVYDEPWFWMISKSNIPKPTFDKKPHKKPASKYSKPRPMVSLSQQQEITNTSSEIQDLKQMIEQQNKLIQSLIREKQDVTKQVSFSISDQHEEWGDACAEEEQYRPPSPASPPPIKRTTPTAPDAPKKLKIKKPVDLKKDPTEGYKVTYDDI